MGRLTAYVTPEWAKEKGSTFGRSFMSLYSGLGPTYVVVSTGY
jgi:hypothetical protein